MGTIWIAVVKKGGRSPIVEVFSGKLLSKTLLGMALSGADTGGSQFFLVHSPQPHLDGRYTVFGRLTSGFDVLDLIVQGDRIRRISR